MPLLPSLVRMLATVFVLVTTLAGCGEVTDTTEDVAVDSTLVNALVDLHLADARGTLNDDPAWGDSLRDLVYEIHGLDSTQLERRLADVALRPGAVASLTEAVESELALELQDTPSSP